jgi:hypothetical protein
MCSGLRGGGLLGGAGVLIGNACWGCPWDGWSEPPIIWIADVGNPSSGKSPGLDAIRDVIGLIESGANEDHKDNLAGWDTNKRLAKIRLGVWEDACKTALKSKKTAPQRPLGNKPQAERGGRMSDWLRRFHALNQDQHPGPDWSDRSVRCHPPLDSEGVPWGLCPSCGGGEFWRLPAIHPQHNPRGWRCCSCYPIPRGAGPCDFCGVPDRKDDETA